MNTQTLWLMTLLVFIGMGILFLINFSSTLQIASLSKKPLDLTDIQTIAIERNGKPYLLTPEKQKELIAYLTRSHPVQEKALESLIEQTDFEKIMVYRCQHPPLIITPVGYIGEDLLFSCPDLNPTGYMREFSAGEFKKFIEQILEN